MPDGVFVTSMKQDNVTITLQGTAQSQERIAELLRNLANNSQWFTKPELISIDAANLVLSPKDQRRVSNYTLKAQVRKPTDVQKPAPAASGAAAAPAPQDTTDGKKA